MFLRNSVIKSNKFNFLKLRHGFQQNIKTISNKLLPSSNNLNIIAVGMSFNIIMLHPFSSCDAAVLLDNQSRDIKIDKSLSVKESTLIQSIKNSFKSLLNYIQYTIKYLERLLTYFLYGIPMIGLAPAAYCFGGIYPPIEDISWNYLIWSITRLGPCFIKMAQWASTRPDLFPEKLVKKMIKLQDDVEVNHSMTTVENTLKTAFGPDWKSVIDLDPNPLGAGSLQYQCINNLS